MLFPFLSKKSLVKVGLTIFVASFLIGVILIVNRVVSDPGNNDPTNQYSQNETIVIFGTNTTHPDNLNAIDDLAYNVTEGSIENTTTNSQLSCKDLTGYSPGGTSSNLNCNAINTNDVVIATVIADNDDTAFINTSFDATTLEVPNGVKIQNVNLTLNWTVTDNAGTTCKIHVYNGTAWYEILNTACNDVISTASVYVTTYYNITPYFLTTSSIRTMNVTVLYTSDSPNNDLLVELKWVNVTYMNYTYRAEIEHNTTGINWNGQLNSINVSVNFTTNVTSTFNLTIYNFNSGTWNYTPCQGGEATSNAWNNWWCNVTDNPFFYNSSDGKIMFRLNGTAHPGIALVREEYVQYYVSYQVGYLEVELIYPNPSYKTYVTQNTTFTVNATVTCRGGPCGYVNGTVRHNLTSTYPDTPINSTEGDKPFYINETPALAMKSCPTNPLDTNELCNLTWVVNATDIDSSWKIGVLFNSSYLETQQNHTNNATVYITTCREEISLAWSSIDFGLLKPNTDYNPAPYNDQNFYNITNKGNCDINLWVKGTNLQNTTLASTIGVGNFSWSNYSKTYTDFNMKMTDSYVLLKPNLPSNQNLTTYYWLSVPPVYSGYYMGSVYLCGNYSSIC